MKAIETRYGGCRFRSRTEARWAVLFDALGIKWEYEREGFELPSGWYLPDFWLPEFRTWVEVKGDDPSAKEIAFAQGLTDQTKDPTLIVCGIPEAGSPQVWLFNPAQTDGVKGCVLTSRGNAVCIGTRTFWLRPDWRTREGRTVPTDFLKAAINKARSARFEHGERG